MFEEGNLLFFRPFLFKNGATPENKFFLVLKKLDGDILLASLPTSKNHVLPYLILTLFGLPSSTVGDNMSYLFYPYPYLKLQIFRIHSGIFY